MTTSDWTAERLRWGTGPQRFEVFLEPTCPFSARAYGKLWPLLERVDGRASVEIHLLSQPWHLLSGIVCRAVAGASTQGKEAARTVLSTVTAHREDFVMEDHHGGPNFDATPREILKRLEEKSGVALTETFALPGLEAVMKRHTKYARQNGVHATPSFMIDGLVTDAIGSGDDVDAWETALD